MYSFTYLTGGMVGICKKGVGLILNVSNGITGAAGDEEQFARQLVAALNAQEAKKEVGKCTAAYRPECLNFAIPRGTRS